ncbi:MAG: patatin-like phospholipase family protein [Myxococcota bacterium]|nr:patatin-like phospholipase family protein [Myxococcales bacterium]
MPTPSASAADLAPAGGAPKRAIVLSGGGARGAYEAGVLRFIVEELPRRHDLRPEFDIVCGTSVGAIHACFLAATADGGEERGERLARIWEHLRVDEVFRVKGADVLSLPRRLLGLRRVAEQLRAGQRPDRLYGLLDTEPLEKLVLDAIPWRDIRTNIEAGHVEAVCVAATQIATGRSIVFTQQRDPLPPWASLDTFHMQPIRLMPVHALASAAIPALFPAVRVGARYYADGGLRLNTPLAPAIRLGANRVLVIGLSHPQPAKVAESLAQERVQGFGNPMFLLGKILNALLLAPIETDLSRLNLVNSFIESGVLAYGPGFLDRINEEFTRHGRRPLQRIDTVVVRPTRDLGMLAGELLQGRHGPFELSRFLRFFFRTFRSGRDAREADLLSYLLFDARYARLLTDLGYQDAAAKEDELVAFFRG